MRRKSLLGGRGSGGGALRKKRLLSGRGGDPEAGGEGVHGGEHGGEVAGPAAPVQGGVR